MIQQVTGARMPLYFGNLAPHHTVPTEFGRVDPLDFVPNADLLPQGCRDVLAAADAAFLVWQLSLFGEYTSLTVQEPSGVLRHLRWMDGVQHHGPEAGEFAARITSAAKKARSATATTA